MTLKLAVSRSRPPVPYMVNLLSLYNSHSCCHDALMVLFSGSSSSSSSSNWGWCRKTGSLATDSKRYHLQCYYLMTKVSTSRTLEAKVLAWNQDQWKI